MVFSRELMYSELLVANNCKSISQHFKSLCGITIH